MDRQKALDMALRASEQAVPVIDTLERTERVLRLTLLLEKFDEAEAELVVAATMGREAVRS